MICMFLGICPFHLRYPISWCIIVDSIVYHTYFHKISSKVPSFILGFGYLRLPFFFPFVRLAKCLSALLIFWKNRLWVLPVFSVIFLFLILLISVLLIISFFLLALGLFCSSFSSSWSCKVSLSIIKCSIDSYFPLCTHYLHCNPLVLMYCVFFFIHF